MLTGNIVERLIGQQLALGRGDSVAYVDATEQVSYAQLHRRVLSYAARLAEAGIQPGARGLIVADDAIPTVVAILALWWRGAVAVPVSSMLTEPEITFIAADCGATFLHVDARSDPLVPRNGPTGVPRGTPEWALPPPDPAPAPEPGESGRAGESAWATGEGGAFGPPPAVQRASDVLLIQYTSGSTGTPKGVLHTRAGVDAVLAGFGRVLDLRPEDTILSTAKLSFGYGFGNSLIFPLAAGARAVLSQGAPDAYRLASAVSRYQPTVLCSVPRLYGALLDRATRDDPPDLGTLRLAVSAGEHLPASICADFTATFGTPLLNGLGATEVLHIVVSTRESRPGSTGQAVPGVQITVRDERGRMLPDGMEGRLHVAGGSVAAGYLDRPEATARSFADGGAYTGDIVRREEDGEIGYVCRHDDLINIGGYKVSPFDIEAAVRDLDGVAQCAVVGSRDRQGLEQAVAYVVPAPDADPEAVRREAVRAFRTGLPPFKRPASVEIVDQLPVTSTGKLARYRLRAGAASSPAVVRMRTLRDGPGRTLVCIPYAGGSSGAFTRLAHYLPQSWRVVAGEATYRDGVTIAEAADAWWRAIVPYVSDGSVLLGHSLGAVLAAAIADAADGALAGAHVVLSAPPVLPGPARPALCSDDDQTLLDGLRATGLLPSTSLTVDEISRLLLPRFRRDIALAPNGFEHPPGTPVHVLLGTDDGLCTRESLATRLPEDRVASLHLVTGSHYFVSTNAAQTAQVLVDLFR